MQTNVNGFIKATRFSEMGSSYITYRTEMQSKNDILELKFFW